MPLELVHYPWDNHSLTPYIVNIYQIITDVIVGKKMLHLQETIVDKLNTSLNTIVYGKEKQVKQAVACLIAGGHLLIEDLPGMGKTTMAQGLARVFGLDFQRIQFTSDLLPADVIGTSVYHQDKSEFTFHQGPLFTQVLLADEINRASPKTQSALLEAMGEYQVTADGQTYPLQKPFFVIATQNPLQQSGTFPLPESQLDRFMMRLSLGYPSADMERQLLREGGTQGTLTELKAVIDAQKLTELQALLQTVKVSDNVLNYLQRLLVYTRETDDFVAGLSPRAALSWLHAAKAWAVMHHRDYVIPDDLQDLSLVSTGHRLMPKDNQATAVVAIERMLQRVNVLD